MPGRHATQAVFILAGSLLVGNTTSCASVPPRGGFSDIEEDIAERAGYEVSWQQGEAEDTAVRARIGELLKEVLTPDTAVQIALFQNPDLQASYELLGVAQADLIEAGMLQNPVLVAAPRFGIGSISGTNVEFDIAQNLLQLLTLRSRKEIASLQFHEARLRVSHRVLDVASEVREAYYEVVATQHLFRLLRTTDEAAAASSEYATRLHAAGNISDLDLARERALYEETRVARDIAGAKRVAPRERLVRLLGLGDDTALKIPETLPGLPGERVIATGLEAMAFDLRLDLQALAIEIDTFERALAAARFYRWIPFVEAGVSAERETEGGWVVGPVLAIEIPIFDQGQVQVARFESMLRERQRAHEALSLDIRRDVRVRHAALRASRALTANFLDTVIPLRERIVRLTQQEVNFMLTSAFELLSAKRDEIAAYRDYVEALRDYWTSRALLTSALGGRLPVMAINDADREPHLRREFEKSMSPHAGHVVPVPAQTEPTPHQHHNH